jgi:16S rRNA G1207 methylase RsmC
MSQSMTNEPDSSNARPQHYFSQLPKVDSAPEDIALALPDGLFRLRTDAGVFSYGAIDPGTRLLLQHAPPPSTDGAIVDLGCGYGAISVVWARRRPQSTVWAIDVNLRALELTVHNAAAARCDNVVTVQPDDVPHGLRVAAIYSNPPIKVGKKVLHDMLTTWLDRLLPDGVAHLVVHRHLGSDSLARWLSGQGYGVAREHSVGGYRLLSVRPRPVGESQ